MTAILYVLASIGALCVLCMLVAGAAVIARAALDRACKARMGRRAIDREYEEMCRGDSR